MDEGKMPSKETFDKIKMFNRNGFVNRRVSINCLFHVDIDKSLKVYGDRYNCLGCNKSGKTETLINNLEPFIARY